jgi:secreted trypsin-like serine protease
MKKWLAMPVLAAAIAVPVGLAAPAAAQTNAAVDELAHDRIVGGITAEPGKWPSMVAIYARKGGKTLHFCGGTIVGRQWVLTAAHCAAAMKDLGPSVSFFIREGTQDLTSAQSHDVDVVDIIANEDYVAQTKQNDVALLKLKGTVSSPRQKLVAKTFKDNLLVDKRMATVVGYGNTAFDGEQTEKLRQVDVPIIGKSACENAWPGKISEANFCAGGESDKDSCQGDSGGPLFATTDTGEKVQVGVVSFGPKGCGVKDVYGVYASVGTFQKWIGEHVSDAEFAMAASSSSSQAAGGLTDGAATAQKPSEGAQVHVDIVEGNKVRVKSYIQVRVSSSVSGSLVIFNENPDGTAYQLYPSKTFPGPDGRADAARIEAGKELRVPSAAQYDKGYRILIEPPLGMNHLRAIVVPESRKIGEIIAAHSDGGTINNLATVISQIVDAVQRGAVGVQVTDRGSAEVSYEIVN